MAMRQLDHECTTDTEKLYTIYKWPLKYWNLLHHVDRIPSRTFFIRDSGHQCRLTLLPTIPLEYDSHCAHVRVEFPDDLDYLRMGIFIGFPDYESEKKEPNYLSMHRKPATQENTVYVEIYIGEEEVENHVSNDNLVLYVKLWIVRSTLVTHQLPVKTHIKDFSTSLRENLKALRDSRKNLCDVTFVIGDQKLFAHKLILAAHSEVFGAMFTSGMQEDERESTVDIIDIDATVFEEFLNYMYSEKVYNLDSVVDKLIIVADKYQVHGVKVMCENAITLRINNKNVTQYLIMADKLGLTNLKNKAIAFVKANM